ncbi:hypothetical protein ELQ35_13515 [Peribacillus cavernae]|uniref:Uncharacterized protein n=1 Tax=Peribacillus cavernae TaxID=1674310 RepID=A0A3S0VHT9_9BACI|nr:hypothetical protein [Peribacillus cavernae]MDQ0217793.1 UDP-galactopyranose mutase [Peribacillus cavernae]RUQ28245.1 hypothetical protein ELQ35_13515 [Peribacillus cavernae]
MEPKQPGNKSMSDFNELSDRVIAEPSESPKLVIKTNFDEENAKNENPYYPQSEQEETNTLLRDYFDE